jgi:hypothetical protein
MVMIMKIITITIIHVENGKCDKTTIIVTKTKVFCAFSRIITGKNQFCRICKTTRKGSNLENEIIYSTLFLVKLEYVLMRKANERLRK